MVTCVRVSSQVSVDAVRQLDRNLFDAYIERRADPIAGSLEPGIYAGYFDWRDCQTPTGRKKKKNPPSPLHLRWATGWGIHSLSRLTLIFQLCGKTAHLF